MREKFNTEFAMNKNYDLNIAKEIYKYLKNEIYSKDKSYSPTHIMYKFAGIKIKVRKNTNVN